MGMLKLMRVLSVVNPLVLAVLVGACGRAATTAIVCRACPGVKSYLRREKIW